MQKSFVSIITHPPHRTFLLYSFCLLSSHQDYHFSISFLHSLSPAPEGTLPFPPTETLLYFSEYPHYLMSVSEVSKTWSSIQIQPAIYVC